MNKRFSIVAVIVMMTMCFSMPNIFSAVDYTLAEMDFIARKYIMELNQQPIKLEVSPVWLTDSRSLLVPLRFIAEMNRFQVGWDTKSGKASFQKTGKDFSIQMKGSFIQINSDKISSPYYIQLKNGRFLLDHRSIEKLFGIKADLDTENTEVVFSTTRDQILYVAPAFSLFDLQGNRVELQKTLDIPETKLVILNFYSSRCPICAKALPNLQKLNLDYKEKGIVVLGINTDTKNMEAERDEVIKKYGLTYPILLDPNAGVYSAYSVAGIPNLFVINKKREIIQHRLGVDENYFVFIRQFLDHYLK